MTASSAKKPNILVLVVDSMRADHVSCYGYHRATTPNIDRLAEEGCLFETAITAAPFSPASYASIFSNLYPHQHGVNGDTVRIWPDHFTRLAEKMKSAGYYTFGISNNDFVSHDSNSVRGFDQYVDVWNAGWWLRQRQRMIRAARKYLGDGPARRLESNAVQCSAKGDSLRSISLAKEFIQAGGPDRPFFGFMVLMDPHAPFDRRRRSFRANPGLTSRFFREFNEGRMWVRTMARREKLAPDVFRFAVDCYDSEIHHADRCVGNLCDWLRGQGILDDTIVVVTADHGEAFGEQGVWGHGFLLADALTRVPLIARCPRYFPAGTRSAALVQLHDLHETCISVALDGRPRTEEFRRCLTQAADPTWRGREVAFSEFPVQTQTLSLMARLSPGFQPGKWGSPMWAARSRGWRYIEYDGTGPELYDLVNDPGETENVITRHPDAADELKARLAEHRRDEAGAGAPSPGAPAEQVNEKMMERLRALGYIE